MVHFSLPKFVEFVKKIRRLLRFVYPIMMTANFLSSRKKKKMYFLSFVVVQYDDD